MSDDEKKKDGVLPRITTRTKWSNFQDDMQAYLEANGLDEGWESDEQPSDTEPEFYPTAETADGIVAEVVPVAEYRGKVTGLTSVPIFIFILGWSRTKPRVTLSAQTMNGPTRVGAMRTSRR